MSQSSSEYLRRKMEAAAKTIAPRPLRDASMVTERTRFKALAGSVARYNGGQMQEYSSEWIAAARAGCAVCAEPVQETVTQECCPPIADHNPATLAFQGSQRGCCDAARPVGVIERCCVPGTTNTFWANGVTPESIRDGPFGPAPPCKSCPPSTARPQCDENGVEVIVCCH